MKKSKRKLLASMLLVAFANLTYMPTLAAIESGQVLNQVGGQYGANLNNVTGATVNSNGVYANITNTQTNSTLNWNSLNTAPGQTLNFNMTAGQTALNRVITPSLSRFAGNLTSTGGRVIISNPMGMIFENGSYTNVNSLILTTKDAQFVNDKLKLNDNNSTAGIKIGGEGSSQYAAVMRVADDLNIISNDIKINNADIFAGNNVNLVTADGVTFVASDNITTGNTNANAIDTSSIKVDGSIIAVKDNVKGNIYFVSKGNKADVKVANSALDGKVKMNVDGSVTLNVIGNLDIKNSNIGGNLVANAVDKTITLKNDVAAITGLTETTKTLEDYITERYGSFTDSTITSFLNDNKGSLTYDSIDSALISSIKNNAKDMKWAEKTSSYKFGTDTKYSGAGTVSIADTKVGGILTAQGTGILLNNVDAKKVETSILASNPITASRKDDVAESYKETQYSWIGSTRTDSTYKWKNNGGTSSIVKYNDEEVVWDKNSQTWTSLETGNTVDLNLIIQEDGIIFGLFTETNYYTVLDGEKVKVTYDNAFDKRWEYDEWCVIFGRLGLSVEGAVDHLTNASKVSDHNSHAKFTPTQAGITIGNETSVLDKTKVVLNGGTVGNPQTGAPVSVEPKFVNSSSDSVFNTSSVATDTIKANGRFTSIKAAAANIEFNGVTADKATVKDSGIVNFISSIFNKKVEATNNNEITVDNSSFAKAKLSADNDITIKNNSSFTKNAKITSNSGDVKISDSSLTGNKAKISANDVKVSDSAVENAVVKAANINYVNTDVVSSKLKASNKADVNSNLIKDSKIVANEADINLGSVVSSTIKSNIAGVVADSIEGSTIKANTINATVSTIDNSKLKGNTTLTGAGLNSTITDSIISDLTAKNMNDLTINNSKVNSLTTLNTGNITLNDIKSNSINIDGAGALVINNANQQNSIASVIASAANIDVDNLAAGTLNLTSSGVTTIDNSKISSLVAKADDNMYIKNSNLGNANITNYSSDYGLVMSDVTMSNDVLTGLIINATRAKLTNVSNTGKLSSTTINATYLNNVSGIAGLTVNSTTADVKLNSVSLASGDITVNAKTFIDAKDVVNGGNITLKTDRPTAYRDYDGDITLDNIQANKIDAVANYDIVANNLQTSEESSLKGNTIAIANTNNFKVKASAADITLDNSSINNSELTATNKTLIDKSTVKSSTVSATNDITVQNGSTIDSSTLKDAKNIAINGNGTLVKYSTVNAADKVTVSNNADVKRNTVVNTKDFELSNAYFRGNNNGGEGAIVNAINVTTTGGQIQDGATINATETISTNGTALSSANLNGKNIDVTHTSASNYFQNSNLKADEKITVNVAEAIGNSTLKANIVDVVSSKALDNSAITSSVANIVSGSVTGSTITADTINATVAGVDNTILNGNTILTGAGLNSTITNSVISSLNANNMNNLTINDSKINTLATLNTGNVSLAGIESNSITISNAGDVIIANSNSAPSASAPTVMGSVAAGQTSIYDFSLAKHNVSDFENKITTQGDRYGENHRISYITGDVNISNVSNIDVINSVIDGNLTETNYSGDANLITSYVAGAYTPDRTNGETSVYDAYIGQYIPYYMVPSDDDFSNIADENDRKKFGSELNITFQRQFLPRGFAAGDDEIALRMQKVRSTARSGNGNSVILTQKFIAD